MEITENWLRKNDACAGSIKAFRRWRFPNGKKDVVQLIHLLIEADKLNWANWLLSWALPQRDKVRYAVFAARSALMLHQERNPQDERFLAAIEAAEAVIENNNRETRAAARVAADAATYTAARAAARAAAYTAVRVARVAAYTAGYRAANAAARVVAHTAVDALYDKAMTAIVEYGLTLMEE